MTQAVYQQRMQRVVEYIEHNLDSNIEVKHLAEIALYSEYHFHRLFRSYCGESVYAFRKRLLLERAMKHLLYSDNSLTDIAASCGDANQAAFNKAFKERFSEPPGAIRKRKRLAPSQPSKPLTQEVIEVKPQIVSLEATELIAARANGPYQHAAEEAWSTIMRFAYSNRLMKENVRSIGISHDDPNITEPERIRYEACLDFGPAVAIDLRPFPNLFKRELPGGCYAKFIHRGSYQNFPQTYAMIFNQWLPASAYQLRDTPCFEVYLNRDPRRTKPENLRTEIHIPLQR